ncbi:hypothetical protein J6TS2_31590 [Heyndrickxia sporothermodurans]|nr:hypothetical protein J6TS2_31590 [Heyndrickxia sporothermodurans]
MRTKVKMNNGEEFIFDIYIDDFIKATKTPIGSVTLNVLLKFDDIYINPCNICSVQKVE